MVDVEYIGEAGTGDHLFEAAPVARKRLPVSTLAAQDDSSGVSAIFLLTTDKDFDHLAPGMLSLEYIDPATPRSP